MDYTRKLLPGQLSRIHIGYTDGRESAVVFETDQILIEAPNWTLDGTRLIVNGNGLLWSIAAEPGGELELIPLDGAPPLNNDHVLAPDGERIFVSADDWHIYEASLEGGPVRRITSVNEPERLHFLHGVSPDGEKLAYIGLNAGGEDVWASGNVYTVAATGGEDVQLTFGSRHADGSEYSPDGEFIYFNTEAFEMTPGHAQIARMKPDGSDVEQLTFDDQVNWFPHIAPDGKSAVYIAFPPGTEGHPENMWVEVKLVTEDRWLHPRTVERLHGGQGTVNVNSWAPDSRRFAYVSYPIAGLDD
ncbi:biopolymer transporter Tol [Microbacterium deminutum]|uniref:Biopolymer transporter Tol n=1 Tax=Microbacterium deminutum TaxID=344164 RepID=A0ABN2QZS0_9MICO